MSDVRLIDANALPNYKCQVTATVGDQKGPAEMRFVFWQDIEKAPAIDAVPVVCARWIHDINNLYGCSACLGRENMSHKKLKRFCPNCGAKMGGGAEG